MNTVVPGQLHTPMVDARLAGQRRHRDRGRGRHDGALRLRPPIPGKGLLIGDLPLAPSDDPDWNQNP
ncbi:MAG: hypothetical protein R3E48_21890 [Burkholderiaceae bacterium]